MKRPTKLARVELDLSSVKARPGWYINDKQAKSIAPVIFAIQQRDGKATPQAILEEAKDPSSPLHAHFDWNDKTAAEAHRLHTAGRLVRSIVYDVKVIEGDPTTVKKYQPMFVHVQEEEETAGTSGYVRFTDAFSSKDLRAQIIENARSEFASWLRRYQTLEALTEVIPLAKKIDERLKRIRVGKRRPKKK